MNEERVSMRTIGKNMHTTVEEGKERDRVWKENHGDNINGGVK